jgi:hypothetical protein
MRTPIAGCLAAVTLALLLPTQAASIPEIGQKDNGWSKLEERALATYVDCWDALESQCGRNIVDDGLANGEPPSDAKVKAWTETMERWLNPPEPEPTVASSIYSSGVAPPAPVETSVPTTSAGGGYASAATVQCESGGDYSIDTGNDYYGAYQFDSGTWDTYGDPAYAEANEAPPAVQDAAAASVPYDAWPNC